MKINDLIEKFKIQEPLPNTLLEIELEEDIINFKRMVYDNGVYRFEGEYQPYWFEGKTDMKILLNIDLTQYSSQIIDNIDDIDEFVNLDLTIEEKNSLISNETVIFIKSIKGNFQSYTSYNIMGGIVRVS